MSSIPFRGGISSRSRALLSKSVGNGDAAATATYDDIDYREDCDDDDDDDDDPLLSFFRVHNTNRVRFNLAPSSSSTERGASSSSSSSLLNVSDNRNNNNDNDNNTMNDCYEKSNYSNKSTYFSGNQIQKNSSNQQLPTLQDKFKKLIIRTNSNGGEQNGGSAAPPPILLKKSTSNLKPPSIKGNNHGVRNDNLIFGDDQEDAYIQKMLEPTPFRRISSFLNSGNVDISGSADRNPRDHGVEQSSKLSCLNSENSDNNSESNDANIQSSLSFNGNSSSPKRIGVGGTNDHTSSRCRRRRFRHPRNPLFRATKYNDTNVASLLKKARYAHKQSFRYQLAMRYYLLALKEITSSAPSGYSDTNNNADDDPLTSHILKSLNDVHHAQVTLSNSSNIVQMGIQHEDANQLVKALRMYTIAYRMRRDALGVNHPSLAVLLNMMGGVQMKRLDYDEAMRLYELSLNGRQDENGGKGRNVVEFRNRNPLTTSVTLRDMGMILEQKGKEDKALVLYHASLRYAVKCIDGKTEESTTVSSERKGGGGGGGGTMTSKVGSNVGTFLRKAAPHSIFGASITVKGGEDAWLDNFDNRNVDSLFLLEEVRMESTSSTTETRGKLGKSGTTSAIGNTGDKDTENEKGEMEVFLEKRFDKWASSDDIALEGVDATSSFYYDGLCLPPSDASVTLQSKQGEKEAYFDIASTLHQIGQLHRRCHRYDAALSAYNASLRGMKQVLGRQHGIIAAIMGNIGNLHMETGDLDEAFNIYQEVLGMETTLLGLSHPEVAVTLHNIATIECSRGNYSDGASFFKQVVDMQKIRYGNENLTVAFTLSCLADAYEKQKNVNGAIKTYEEALKIRKAISGDSHLDVGRIMHKIGRLVSSLKDYSTADIYMKRACEIYSTNNLTPDHVFQREMEKDIADIRAQLAFGKK